MALNNLNSQWQEAEPKYLDRLLSYSSLSSGLNFWQLFREVQVNEAFQRGRRLLNIRGPKRWKIIELPLGQINDPLSRKQYSLPFLQQLPSLGLGPLKGFLSWPDALQGPLTCLVRCFRNYRETRTTSRATGAKTLMVRLLKTHFFALILDCKKSTAE